MYLKKWIECSLGERWNNAEEIYLKLLLSNKKQWWQRWETRPDQSPEYTNIDEEFTNNNNNLGSQLSTENEHKVQNQ